MYCLSYHTQMTNNQSCAPLMITVQPVHEQTKLPKGH